MVFLYQVQYLFPFVSFSELHCGEVLEIFSILRAVLLPVKSPVDSAFLNYFFYVVLSASVVACLV